MILFVFEDERLEPKIFKTLEYLYFGGEERIVCSFGNNIYELYRQLSQMDGFGDIVAVMKERYSGKPDNPFVPEVKTSDFSEIYLFFDYDFQNKNLSLEQMNIQIEEMLEMFDDETDNGKLYINYPMIEAVRYTKSLPDSDFVTYNITRDKCMQENFKNIVQHFSDYKSFDFIMLDFRKEILPGFAAKIKNNWELLKMQHTVKANFLCCGNIDMPVDKDCISQKSIFAAQLSKYAGRGEIAILAAIPVFLFDYFKN